MSARPPIITGSITGVQPTTKTPTPPPAASKENKDIFPRTLSNGTILLAILGSGLHEIQLIQQTDASQKFKFLVDCKCGVQGRAHLEEDVRNYAAYHLKNKGIV